MNQIERKMLDLLVDLKETSGAVAVKAEFEAEGTRVEELLRLLEISRKAGVKIGLKIGGCEAMRDLLEAKQFGVEYVIAPMVETPYALQKYIDAVNKVFSPDERLDTSFLFNVETESTYQNLRDLLAVGVKERGVDGIVFGRVDFAGSCGMGREGVNSENILHVCREVAAQCKESALDLVVGGGVSVDAIDFLKHVSQVYLSRFETRKVIFDGECLESSEIRAGLLKAVHFELLWLLNKRDYYGFIAREDEKRIEMLEKRWKVLS